MYCPKCGKQNRDTSSFCMYCGGSLPKAAAVEHSSSLKSTMRPNPSRLQAEKTITNKRHLSAWKTISVLCVAVASVVGGVLFSGAKDEKPSSAILSSSQYESGSAQNSSTSQAPHADFSAYAYEDSRTKLSASCDYLLCCGADEAGNEYELVANQKESALGYEITVGVIKNNQWCSHLSKDFPFLSQDNLFDVSMNWTEVVSESLSNPNVVINKLYFVDSGGFMLKGYHDPGGWGTCDNMYIFYSCDTEESYKLVCDTSQIDFLSVDAEFTAGQVDSFGQVYTDDGELLICTVTDGISSGWIEDRTYDWSILDTRTMDVRKIASNVKGLCPISVLSEGMVFASDNCFYNTRFEKTIDLSSYRISSGNIYFENGFCTFEAENSIGTKFEITIDKQGSIISETSK